VFAVLACAAQLRLANNIPAASGASRYAILGKLVEAPRLAHGAGLLGSAQPVDLSVSVAAL